MLNAVDTRPNYRDAICCATCEFVVDVGNRLTVLLCNKHESEAVEINGVCDDHPLIVATTIALGEAEIVGIPERADTHALLDASVWSGHLVDAPRYYLCRCFCHVTSPNRWL